MIRPKSSHNYHYKPVHKPYRYKETDPKELRTLGWGGGCWCGKPNGHTWPGEEDGAPHPR